MNLHKFAFMLHGNEHERVVESHIGRTKAASSNIAITGVKRNPSFLGLSQVSGAKKSMRLTQTLRNR